MQTIYVLNPFIPKILLQSTPFYIKELETQEWVNIIVSSSGYT